MNFLYFIFKFHDLHFHIFIYLYILGRERDIAGFKEFFENPLYRVDGLKIYPTLVMRWDERLEMWRWNEKWKIWYFKINNLIRHKPFLYIFIFLKPLLFLFFWHVFCEEELLCMICGKLLNIPTTPRRNLVNIFIYFVSKPHFS